MKKILIIFGTRPEAIKMAPLLKSFLEKPDLFQTKLCVTAQHREMLDQVLDFFNIIPDYDLDLMKPDQDLFKLTSNIIESLQSVMVKFSPDFVFVHGDTTTTMASSLAAFYSGATVCHIEAGLRTQNKFSPFPEEVNRQIVGRIADFHFAPTETARCNLLKENIPSEHIIVTGNTVIDALLYSVKRVESNPSQWVSDFKNVIGDKKVILVTGHRRENHGEKFEKICGALKEIANRLTDVIIVYPVHLNPKVQVPVNKILGNKSNVLLISPLSYPDFVWLMNRSTIVITDSGGVQEEAPTLGKPVLVLRENTERPEAVNEGTVLLVGTDAEAIVNETLDLLSNNERFRKMSELQNPYGDGTACDRIIEFMISI